MAFLRAEHRRARTKFGSDDAEDFLADHACSVDVVLAFGIKHGLDRPLDRNALGSVIC